MALDYPLTQRELLDGLARGLGRSPTFICLPAALVRAVASVADGVSFMVPGLRGLSGARVTRLGLGENPYPSQRGTGMARLATFRTAPRYAERGGGYSAATTTR